MKWSKFFIPTLKEDPQEAEAISHKLMVRAGIIRRLSAGAYTYLPLGFRALEKARKIISEEMDSAGAAQLLMPALQPVELWKETGRYDVIGDVMLKFKDRHGKEIALGPTHEEIVTDLVAREVHSYKDLPVILYQIQTKFRDELRPRFGVIRSCEFIMKDAYSFDKDIEGMEESYKKIFDAYCRIFERCALPYIAVEADSGMMGGSVSHEFMVPSEIGEDRIIICDECKYAASTEVAEVRMADKDVSGAVPEEMEKVDTPGKSSVKDVSELLNVDAKNIIKALVYMADDKPMILLIRGDHEANEPKVIKALSLRSLVLAKESEIIEHVGDAVGFTGPVGVDVPIYADQGIKNMINAVAGSNEKDKHLVNVNHGRDFQVKDWIDARIITEEDHCPKCGKTIQIKNAIEIGHTFKLGSKYSESLNATFLDDSGKTKTVMMGCYGIGVNRIIASLIESSNDENGIVWPSSLAPAQVVLIPIGKEGDEVSKQASILYEKLIRSGVEVMIDDREGKSAGVRFKDADLLGFPLQVIVGKKNIVNGQIEIKIRKSGERKLIDLETAVKVISELISSDK